MARGARRTARWTIRAIVAAAAIGGAVWLIRSCGSDSSRRPQAAPRAPDRMLARPAPRIVMFAIAGSVVDGDGRPISGATVLAARHRPAGSLMPRSKGKDTRTSATGTFRIDGLSEGFYTLAAHAPGFAEALREHVEVAPGAELGDVTLRLSKGGVSLSGRVLDAG